MRRRRERRVFALGVVAIALLAVLVRLRFLDVPLSVDEGGYAAVARFWASGSHIYRDVWVDRPQGLLLLYRGAFDLFGPHAWAVRALATVWGAGLASVVALLVARVADRRTGLVAGALVAVLSVGPRIEGFAANGELLVRAPGRRGAPGLRDLAGAASATRSCSQPVRSPPSRSSSSSRATTAAGRSSSGSCWPPGAAGFPGGRRCARSALVAIGAAVPVLLAVAARRRDRLRPLVVRRREVPAVRRERRDRIARPIARTCSGRRS